MSNPKLKHVVLVICVAVVVFSMIAIANAYIRPANPTMDYVPQNVGIYDTYYQNFKESDCRWCHGASTADRHHDTWWALTGNCLYCHVAPGWPYVPAERDCKVCHVDGGVLGDYGFPHHRSDLADAGVCIGCHNPNLLVETNIVPTPSYIPTNITPTPYSCENCHWPSGNAPHQAETITGNAALFEADWLTWIGYPVPSHWPTGLANPAPIEANGPMFSGNLWDGTAAPTSNNDQRPTPWAMRDKKFQPMDGTHHEIAGKVYPKCYDCHGTNPDTDPSWDPTNPYLIRFCENCHDIGTLHRIEEHTKADNTAGYNSPPYWIDGTLTDGFITDNNKCVACHGDNLGDLPPVPATVPDHILMRPWFGPPGIVVDLIPLNAPVPLTVGDLGPQTPFNEISMKQSTPAPGAFISVPIYSWAENFAQLRVPGWQYVPGETKVKVKQAVDTNDPPTMGSSIVFGLNNNQDFILRKSPEMDSVAPGAGNWGTVLTIDGAGFEGGSVYSPAVQEKYWETETMLDAIGNEDGICDALEKCDIYGFSSYVELGASADRYRVTDYGLASAWTDTQIKAKLLSGTLLDVNTGNPVPDGDLYVGDWQVFVITDYFKVTNINPGTYLGYNLGLAGLDAASALIYRDESPAKIFIVTKDPYIHWVDPNPVPAGNTATISGSNFGVSGAEIMLDGFGDDDGKCENGEKCEVKIWNKLHTTFKRPVVKSWSDTAIVIKVPFVGVPPYPKKKDVQVVVPGAPAPNSNFFRISVKKPGT